MTWVLSGTDSQQRVVLNALERIKFPLSLLKFPGNPELGWRDLNGPGGFNRANEDHTHLPGHGHGDEPEPLIGAVDGRSWVMGVFYPGSARIYLDNRLEAYPEVAAAVVGAEIAHAVDEFLPLTDAHRTEIIGLLGHEGHENHTWWEKNDYGTEYYTLVGEDFMRLFVEAYTDIPFGDASHFVHGNIHVPPETIRRVIGVERTDWTPPPPPPEDVYSHYGKSKIYHRQTHRMKRARHEYLVRETYGLRPCKQCKPVHEHR